MRIPKLIRQKMLKKIRSFMSKGELKNTGNYSEACKT